MPLRFRPTSSLTRTMAEIEARNKGEVSVPTPVPNTPPTTPTTPSTPPSGPVTPPAPPATPEQPPATVTPSPTSPGATPPPSATPPPTSTTPTQSEEEMTTQQIKQELLAMGIGEAQVAEMLDAARNGPEGGMQKLRALVPLMKERRELQKKLDDGSITDVEHARLEKVKAEIRNEKDLGANFDAAARGTEFDPKLQNFLDQSFQAGGSLQDALKSGTAKLGELMKNPGMSLVREGEGATDPQIALLADVAARNAAGRQVATESEIARSGRGNSAIASAMRTASQAASGREQADLARQGLLMREGLARQDLGSVLPILGEKQRELEFGRGFLGGESARRDAAAAAASANRLGTIRDIASAAGAAFSGGASLAAEGAIDEANKEDEEGR